MDGPKDSLDDIFAACWASLVDATTLAQHPMRTGVLATNAGSHSEVRTVVLRAVDIATEVIACNTDRRTEKVTEIVNNPQVNWLFFHPVEQIQLRLRGRARVLVSRDETECYWSLLPTLSYRNFLTARAPGMPVNKRTGDLPTYLDTALDTSSDTPLETPVAPINAGDIESARDNFAVIETQVDHIDWVCLHRSGNSRAQFSCAAHDGRNSASDWQPVSHPLGPTRANLGHEDRQWRGTWVVP
jgi:pyridoxamine 5'-phosphate oxidase